MQKASEELGNLVDSCSEIPYLVCNGVISMIKEGGQANKLKQRISALQAMRAVSTEFRQHIDKFVCVTIKDVRNLARDLWLCKRDLEKSRHDKEEKSKITHLDTKWKDKTMELDAMMSIYFPTEVVNEYLSKVNQQYDRNGQSAFDFTCLHATVSMFFAMATQRCYVHTCGGYKLCTKTHNGRTFNCIFLYGRDGTKYVKCVYSSEECICSLKQDQNNMSPGKLTYISKMAIEMYRRRCVFDVEDIRKEMAGDERQRKLAQAEPGPMMTFVLSHPDIDIPSTQRALDITPQELEDCKNEIKRKNDQTQRIADAMASMRQRFIMEDVNNAFATNKKYGFKSFDALKKVFPGIACVISESAVVSPKDTTCCFQIRLICECFKELSFMNDLRNVDKHSKCGMASSHAYEFMSGKSCGIMIPPKCIKTWPLVNIGAQALLTYNTNSVVCFPSNKKVTVASLCSALHLFDKMNERWEIKFNTPPERASIFTEAGTTVFVTSLVEVCKRLCETSFYDGLRKHVKTNYDDELPSFPRLSSTDWNFTHDNEVAKFKFAKLLFKSLMKRPETKCFAIRYFGILPSSLLDFVSQSKNQVVLRELDISPNPDAV